MPQDYKTVHYSLLLCVYVRSVESVVAKPFINQELVAVRLAYRHSLNYI